MPGGDRTGPSGQGPLTGRGFGPCGAGLGCGRGRGFRSRFWRDPVQPYYPAEQVTLTKDEQKKILEEERKAIQEELKAIENKIKELNEQK